ncbi:MAG: aminomethyl-transferring glycine dehydrogenase subunit GcvPA, partial [Desulfobacterales bacterium]|nr:aminomethyl-transferring glycine dehydrogenase subunit GcvPA [Desulfobacterales bacterium]
MRYLPHTSKEIEEMLQVVGAETLDDLFVSVPGDCRRASEMELPDSLTEWELNELMDGLAGQMGASPAYQVYMGAGSYEHHIPASASYVLSRSEFVTSYTPYQPEISQGTLQGIFEYQTLVARLLGMDVANASLYDGAMALAEGLLMAVRATRKKTAAISSLIHPLYRRVVQTYFKPTEYKLVELPYTPDGRVDLGPVDGLEDLAAVGVQSPNFFGCIEDLKAAGEKAHEKKALLVASFTEPLAYGLLKSPGELGADIACGEGQSFGVPRSFGGPALVMFAAKKQYVRPTPGRRVAPTTDMDGKRGFVLTLSTREQHIRREKATSNICTNSGLCAMAAGVYMASLGGSGLRELSRLNRDKAEYLKAGLKKAGFGVPFES